ncbi:cAMP-binding domain of CRP or a regulatory subunit of cAMP-dependent protein kinases [Tranquillimonas rosea]|uniref:cAMP-binding domain of CRP or a regulatory subunit of cAMP-dependent protein kinases n=1 Tax=Tranquillimonas rosea TaxID=641238 RepID=A0A1H9U9G0_9RHOB|nr:Crp/Fnr family transcriptional regulator [Tranquillimonas rosea]SES05733.1 cAMP-binding domain of CRP or a regulatory subunit of cAMP-dependent protein kinases [Tranquillimonas rosea]
MSTRCRACPLHKLDQFESCTDDEIRVMERFKSGELTVEPGATLLLEGSNSPQLFTVLRGQGLRYKTLQNGRRQIINFVLPGDFLGLQAGIMREMQHSVEATTRMTLCVFNRADVFNLFKNHPRRAFDLTWIAATEEHFLGDALATVGQRTALERLCWAVVRLFMRAKALGMVEKSSFPFPYRQQDLADALGLSLVHTNKTLAKLRDRQLASWRDGRIHVMELETLAEIAETDPELPEPRPLM